MVFMEGTENANVSEGMEVIIGTFMAENRGFVFLLSHAGHDSTTYGRNPKRIGP